MKLEVGNLYKIEGKTCMLLGLRRDTVEDIINTFVYNDCGTGEYKYTTTAVMTKSEWQKKITHDLFYFCVLSFMPVEYLGEAYDASNLMISMHEDNVLALKEKMNFNRQEYMIKSKLINPRTPDFISKEDFEDMLERIMQKFEETKKNYDFQTAFSNFFREKLSYSPDTLYFNKKDEKFYVYYSKNFHLVDIKYKKLKNLRDLFRLRYLAENNNKVNEETVRVNDKDLLLCVYYA